MCFYGPVWYSLSPLLDMMSDHDFLILCRVILLTTLAIYITVGRDILQKHRALRSFSDAVNATTSTSKSVTGQEGDGHQLPPYSVLAEPAELAESARSSEKHMNATIVNYARYSFIFFVALVVTWVSFPSLFLVPDFKNSFSAPRSFVQGLIGAMLISRSYRHQSIEYPMLSILMGSLSA